MAALSPNLAAKTTPDSRELRLFDLAFELAYSIHVNKELAFFVAEDALEGLPSMLGRQEKHRKPIEQLRGFFKWGERSRPIRKTVRLNELQMLQWLVYKQSEFWERKTEQGEDLYLPTEEDLIVRYIKHLVFLTVRRDSFYVALAVGSLLHQFSRRETRLFYDILTQSDSARMKDTNYIGKQRLEMLERVSRRFGEMIQTIKIPGDEKQLLMRPTTQWVINLVNECLRRFTPWETACVVQPGFDVTDIPGLYFSNEIPGDEEHIAMNRVHTVLHPECLIRFAEGLSNYVRTLPEKDQDRRCNYDSLDERLAVPHFSNFPSGSERGDRFQSPKLTAEDYIRLQRMLDARSHRRKSFIPQTLSVYVDDALSCSFNPRTQNQVRRLIGPEAGVIEVRGRDTMGELTLATLLVGYDRVLGTTFKDSVVHPGGQKITVRLIPVADTDGTVKGEQLEVSYTEPSLMRPISRLTQRVWSRLTGIERSYDPLVAEIRPEHAWFAKAGVAVVLIIMASAFIWWRFSLPSFPREVKPLQETRQPQREARVEGNGSSAPVTPSPQPERSSTLNETRPVIARAIWSTNRKAALAAIPIEPSRGATQTIDLSDRQTVIVLSLPLYDDEGRMCSHYRLTLSAAETRLWQQTLRAPKVSLTGYSHTLEFLVFTRRLTKTGPYDLHIEGEIQSRWCPLSNLVLSPKK